MYTSYPDRATSVIKVHQLSKAFAGLTAVHDLDFEAHAGEIFGLLGPNGAGKTTTIRIMATVLAPTSGTVTVNGHDVVTDSVGARAQIGVLTADFGLYDRMSGRENIRYAGRLYGLGGPALERRIDGLVRSLEMERFADQRAGKYSTGMKQKAAIARSVVHDPPIVIFDEPTAGLDVIAAQTVVKMMQQFRQQGKLVILSTHDMYAAGQLCDRVAILHRGRLVGVDSVPAILARTGSSTLESAFLSMIGSGEAAATLRADEEHTLAAAKPKSRFRLWPRS